MAKLRSSLQLNSSPSVAGNVAISQKALVKIMQLTAGTVKNVDDMAKSFQKIFNRRFPGVQLINDAALKLVNQQLVADISIKINYGVNVIQTSYQVQQEIINQFKEMLDLELTKVNVRVIDLIEEVHSEKS
ncbi:MAG: Asp23/Gls24 family envelope stress response protein [Lactobacillaceae bacterium]